LLGYELLFLTLQETEPNYEVNAEINRILDTQRQRVIPADEALRLFRRELIAQAKAQMPFWKTVSLLNRLVRFFKGAATGPDRRKKRRRSSRGRTAEEELSSSGAKVLGGTSRNAQAGATADAGAGSPGAPRTQSTRARQLALQKAMANLKIQFVGSSSLDESMDALIERWNPLFDPQAKANLVEDVNSLIRDFLRKLKKGFLVKPPDAQRIRTMSASLAENHAFDQIKRREDLRRYMELYMIQILGGGQ
jgi:hypothetical protein